MKEICDYLKNSDIAKLERLNMNIGTIVKTTALDIYINVKIISSDFTNFEILLEYLKW